ncbi:hypothetical protein [Saprospira grandis]|uniref:Tetratricopeptide repeat domain protein n=1 Tax=Saprospira grandis (strain Lewin) TaxID=984262 RepID=H6L647_SAPGL|nr:hypothetical protein [Saprospira grandis]AFC22948.1 tetratricopeptide repeat domain protein [Saprospira grandis str. Lewin]
MKLYTDVIQVRKAIIEGSFFNSEKIEAASQEDREEVVRIIAQLPDFLEDGFEDNIFLLQKALRLDPNNPVVYQMLGEYEDNSEAELFFWNKIANSKYESIIKTLLEEEGPDIWEKEGARKLLKDKAAYGELLLRRGYPKEAIPEYQKIFDLDPKDHLNLKGFYGASLLEEQEYEAFEELLECSKGVQSRAEHLFNHALYLYRKEGGRNPKANRLLVEADKLNEYISLYLIEYDMSVDLKDFLRKDLLGPQREAMSYIRYAGYLWRETKGTKRWLHNFHRAMKKGK